MLRTLERTETGVRQIDPERILVHIQAVFRLLHGEVASEGLLLRRHAIPFTHRPADDNAAESLRSRHERAERGASQPRDRRLARRVDDDLRPDGLPSAAVGHHDSRQSAFAVAQHVRYIAGGQVGNAGRQQCLVHGRFSPQRSGHAVVSKARDRQLRSRLFTRFQPQTQRCAEIVAEVRSRGQQEDSQPCRAASQAASTAPPDPPTTTTSTSATVGIGRAIAPQIHRQAKASARGERREHDNARQNPAHRNSPGWSGGWENRSYSIDCLRRYLPSRTV